MLMKNIITGSILAGGLVASVNAAQWHMPTPYGDSNHPTKIAYQFAEEIKENTKKTEKKVSFFNAVIIGVSQAIAMLPGISRSGATISTSVLLGIDRTRAAKFSFLMVVPLIFGKIGKDVLSGDLNFQSSEMMPIIAGFIAAFLAGLLACKWMISLVKKSKLSYFSVYCAIVGFIAIGYSLLN